MYAYTYRPIVHAAECLKNQAQDQKALRAYLAKWPKYCRHCNGNGGYEIPQTRWEPADYDFCGRCIEQGHCPRCAQPLPANAFDVQWIYCDICDWLESTTPDAPIDWITQGDACECEWSRDRDAERLLRRLPALG
jgi:hypothetical protein